MLSVIGLRHPNAGYYLADHRAELPDVLGPRPEGWWGRQAEALGYEGRGSAGDLEALCAGRVPAGPRLARREVLAYDLVVAAPKEASLLLASSDERAAQLLVAHGRGVEAALSYLERRGASVLVGEAGARSPAAVSGLAVHRSTHASSRAGDPHLHTHCLLANAAQGPDGRFRALDGRGLRAHAMAADALYRAELGYQLRRELAPGASDLARDRRSELKAAFSSRSAELAQHRERALPLNEEAREAQLVRWHQRLATLGFSPGGRELDANAVEPARRRLNEHALAASLLGDDHRRGRRDAVEAWARAAGPVPATEVERSVDLLLGGPGEGVGVGEEPLLPRRLLAPVKALARLGPRPLEPEALADWLRRAEVIGRDRAALGCEPLARARARA